MSEFDYFVFSVLDNYFLLFISLIVFFVIYRVIAVLSKKIFCGGSCSNQEERQEDIISFETAYNEKYLQNKINHLPKNNCKYLKQHVKTSSSSYSASPWLSSINKGNYKQKESIKISACSYSANPWLSSINKGNHKQKESIKISACNDSANPWQSSIKKGAYKRKSPIKPSACDDLTNPWLSSIKKGNHKHKGSARSFYGYGTKFPVQSADADLRHNNDYDDYHLAFLRGLTTGIIDGSPGSLAGCALRDSNGFALGLATGVVDGSVGSIVGSSIHDSTHSSFVMGTHSSFDMGTSSFGI